MTDNRTRDYQELATRIGNGRPKPGKSRELVRSDGYPVYHLSLNQAPEFPWILLIGGVHGDEPAGVEAMMSLLENGLEPWCEFANFEAIPCLNPYGYAHDTRGDAGGRDLNWSFEEEEIPMIAALRRLIAGRRFLFTLDMHEDWESPGYYLYELCRGDRRLGSEIVRHVEAVCPLNREPEIDGSPSSDGLVHPDLAAERQRRGTGIPLALYDRFTDHLFTSETPTALSMERRVEAHRSTFETVMRSYFPQAAN